MDISDWPDDANKYWAEPGQPEWDPCTVTAAFRKIEDHDVHFVAHFTGPTLKCAQGLVKAYARESELELVKARINEDQSAVRRFKQDQQFSLDNGYWPGEQLDVTPKEDN